MTSEVIRFDLRSVCNQAISNDWAPPIRLAIGIGLGLSVVFAGLYAGLIRAASRLPAWGTVVIVVSGVAMLASTFYYRRNYPDTLELSDDEIRLSWLGRRSGVNLDFDVVGCQFQIIDRRGIPPPGNLGRKLPDFYLHPPDGPSTPIPPAAFEAVMAAAKSRGLRIDRMEWRTLFKSMGTTVVWTVRH